MGSVALGARPQVDALRQSQQSCTLRIITINDVYELDNLAYLDGVIRFFIASAFQGTDRQMQTQADIFEFET